MRLKRIAFSWELVRMFLAQDNVIPAAKIVAEGIPADAVVTEAHSDGQAIWLTVESSEFEEVKDYEEIPTFCTRFERLP